MKILISFAKDQTSQMKTMLLSIYFSERDVQSALLHTSGECVVNFAGWFQHGLLVALGSAANNRIQSPRALSNNDV